MSNLKVLLYLIGLFSLCNAAEQNVPVIRRNNTTFSLRGSITGTILPGYRTPFIEAFLGVPFAEPPLADLRFSNPVPFQDFWSYDHIANEERDMCLQRNPEDFQVEGTEDCLYLNVFRPLGTTSNNLLPVIINIHGGGFIGGSPSTILYGPKYFMDQGDVIFVTPAYRLGILGFLSTGNDDIPGNFVFKDQAMAIQWVKDNIIYFNGDPNQITIMGQSAGGSSVHFHMFSPLSRDLFVRVASMSGTAIAPFAYVNEDPLSLTRLLAQEIGIANFNTLTTAQLAAEFKDVNPQVILEASRIFEIWLAEPFIVFGPVVESDNPNAFLVEDPRVSISNGNFKICPLLMTIVPEEGVVRSGGLLMNDTHLENLNDNFDLAIGVLNDFSQDDPQLQDKIDKVIDFYFDGTRNIDFLDNGQRLTDMFSDRMFHYPFYSAYKFHSKRIEPLINPLYLIEFNYRGPYSFSYLYAQSNMDFGVVHGDDAMYLMDNAVFPLFDLGSVEAQLITEMVDIYVNFATGRIPHEKFTTCTFDEADPDKPCEYLYIGNAADEAGYEIHTRNTFNMEMVNFWRSIDRLF